MRHKFKRLETQDHLGMVWVDEVCIYCGNALYLVQDLEICSGELKPRSYTEDRFLDFLDNL